jgi:hypothetical protein
MRILILASLWLLWSNWIADVQCYSTGAGGCEGGVAAIGGYHLNTDGGRPVDINTLEVAGIVVRIGDTVLSAGTSADFPTGQDLDISVSATQIPFLGFLIRIQTPDDVSESTGTIVPVDTETAQPAAVCVAPVQGVTHLNSNPKLAANATIRFDQAVEGVIVDVTIVFTNGVPASISAYTGYTVQFVGLESDAPTVVEGPTTAPISTVTLSPTISNVTETDSPTSAPSAAPIATEETEGPSATPSSLPTETQEFIVPTTNPSTAAESSAMPSSSPKDSTSSPSLTSSDIITESPSGRMTKTPVSSTSRPTSEDGDKTEPPATLGLSTKRPSSHPTRANKGVSPQQNTKPSEPNKTTKSKKPKKPKKEKGAEKDTKEVGKEKKIKKKEKDGKNDESEIHKSKIAKEPGKGKGNERHRNLVRDRR